MKYRRLIILTLIPFALTGCKRENSKNRENDAPIEVDISTPIDDIEEKDYKKIPSYIYAKLYEYNSYKSVTTGQTKSMGITQSIDSTVIKGEYSYYKNESHSVMVNTIHQAYYHDSKAVYRDSDSGNYSVSSIDEYLNIYGTYPFDAAIEGYTIGEDSIVSATKVSKENSSYVFKVVFDNEKSTNNVKIQMKKSGELDDYPTFSLIEMNFTIKGDFTLVKIDLHAKYTIQKVMNSNCEQNYTVSFTNYNENISIPDLDNIKPLFSN